jgi:hypothetical protein
VLLRLSLGSLGTRVEHAFFCLSLVNRRMARHAERDQVVFGIVAGLAAKLLVVNLKIGHRAASLTPPAVPAQDSLTKFFV